MDNKIEIEVVLDENLSEGEWDDKRYIIVDKETGEILDDAQGYGYKSKPNAYRAWAYKNRDKSKDKEREEKKKEVQKWCKKHRKSVENLEDAAFEIAKGAWGPDDKFDTKLVKRFFKEEGFTELPFTIGEFLKYWQT